MTAAAMGAKGAAASLATKTAGEVAKGSVQAASALGSGVGKTTDNVLNGRPADKGVIESMAGGAAVGVGGQMVGELLPAPVGSSPKVQAGATMLLNNDKRYHRTLS